MPFARIPIAARMLPSNLNPKGSEFFHTPMRSMQTFLRFTLLCLLSAGMLAQAATVTGTVTNKTSGKPAAGDSIALLDVQSSMAEVAKASTDAHGHYALAMPGSGPYLIRVTHQGAGYFIAAPRNGGPGDISVYDVAGKVNGVSIEADVIECQADSSQLEVMERYFVHNTSSPPVTQWSKRSFSIVLPPEAVVNAAQAQRPSGLPTSIHLDPDGPKGHYSYNFPIEPDQGEKDTLFEVSYTVPYSAGSYSFKSVLTLPAENVAVLLPLSMTLKSGSATSFHSVQGDAGVSTFIAKNVQAGQVIDYSVSGTGSIPSGQQNGSTGQQGETAAGGQPGGGIGAPINTPDPLSKYKWWILGGLALLLAAAAAFLLRKPVDAPAAAAASLPMPAFRPAAAPAAQADPLMTALKEAIFAFESDRVAGKISQVEYDQVKSAIETVLKHAQKRKP